MAYFEAEKVVARLARQLDDRLRRIEELLLRLERVTGVRSSGVPMVDELRRAGRPRGVSPGFGAGDGGTLVEIERAAILSALGRRGWSQKRACLELGVTARVLNYKLKALGLSELVAAKRRGDEDVSFDDEPSSSVVEEDVDESE